MDLVLLGIPIGIVLLYIGSEWMVDGAKKMAFRLGIAPFIVGLTVVAFGSSAPEAITSLVSGDNPQIIMGNVVGSNIANVGLAIALSALISPIICKFKEIRFELIIMMVSVFTITLLSTSGMLGIVHGIFLILALFAFVIAVYFLKKNKGPDRYSGVDPDKDLQTAKSTPMWKCIIMVLVGIIALYFGATSFIDGATELARILGVSDLMIGLLVVAVGTSLPEICICLLAARRNESDLAVSNIVGSLIFNCFFVLGLGLLVTDVQITHYMLVFHMPVMIIMAALLFVMIRTGNRITRPEGVVLFALYAVYIGSMALFPELTQGVM